VALLLLATAWDSLVLELLDPVSLHEAWLLLLLLPLLW
jgi:hypothetical protein